MNAYLFLLVVGTDIIRKRLQEHGGQTDMTNLKPIQNHNPHIRAQSLMMKRANSPSLQSSPALPSKMPHNHKVPQSSSAYSMAHPNVTDNHPMERLDHIERQQFQPQFQNPDIRVTDNGDERPTLGPHSMGNHRDYRDNQYRDTSHPRDLRDSQPREYRESQHPRDYRDIPQTREYRDNQRPPPEQLRHNNVQNQRTSDYDRGPHTLPRRRDNVPGGRFSELLNSTTVTDHFDQYRTLRDDSGLGRDLDSPEERDRFVQKVRGAQTLQQTAMYTDRSPDSGLSDTDDSRFNKTRPLPRRKTLPSIMRGVPPNAAEPVKPKTSPRHRIAGETVHSNENLTPEESDTYIIENGIRKRVTAEVYAQPSSSPQRPKASDEVPKDLPNRYHLVSQAKFGKGANRGSLPDVTACGELKKHVMPREEVAKLSTQRREQLRRQQEEEERRKQQEIVLRLTDFKVNLLKIHYI